MTAATTPEAATPPPSTRSVPSRRTRRRVAYGVGAVDTVDRVVLAVAGLALAAAGVAVVLLATGALDWSETPASLWRRAARSATGSPNEAAAIATAGCLVLALLALWWVRAQLHPVGERTKLTTLRLGRADRGRTTVPAVAVAKAAGADFASLFGVLDADVRLLAIHPRPRAEVTLELGLDADPVAVLAEAVTPVGHLARALGADSVDAEFRIRFGNELRRARSGSRVR